MKGGRFLSGIWFRLRGVPGVFRRFKFWLLAGIFVVALVALGPVLGPIAELLTSAARALGRILLPVLDNKVGRFILVNIIILLVLLFLYRKFKHRARLLLGSWALDRFLAGLLHLAGGRYDSAAKGFEKVVRVGKLVNLETAVPVYPEILADARIKLALAYREMGEVEKAMRHLELLKVGDLAPSMRRELAEAKAYVYSLSGDLMEETIDREITNALTEDGSNRRLLKLRRERSEAAGDFAESIKAQRKLLKHVRKTDRSAEKSRLSMLHARHALSLYRAGKPEEALAEISRSRSYDSAGELASLVAGDIAAGRGDERDAVREWVQAPSLAGLDRVRRMLEGGGLTSEGDLEYLASAFSCSGILIVLGEHYLRLEKLLCAKNCVRKYEELGFSDRRSSHLAAEILRVEGDAVGAEKREWRALTGFLGADGVS